MPKKSNKQVEWVDTPEGRIWLKGVRSCRKTLGLIVGEWEIFSAVDILLTQPITEQFQVIFRKAAKRWPEQDVSIVWGNWFNFHPDYHDRAPLDGESWFLREQLEAGFAKTGDYRYLQAAEKISNPIVEWRDLIP